MPYKDGGANEGHSCVKGRFAFGYATHKDRIATPMIREKITDPWQVVSWDEAINYAAKRFKETQAKYGQYLDRRHHLVAHDERRNLRRTAHGSRRLQHQQH